MNANDHVLRGLQHAAEAERIIALLTDPHGLAPEEGAALIQGHASLAAAYAAMAAYAVMAAK